MNDLANLGWTPFFQQQLPNEVEGACHPARVTAHFGSKVLFWGARGEFARSTQLTDHCGELAVGDWVLFVPGDDRPRQRLERNTLLARKAAGETVKRQVIAANVDTLFIVSSCNLDFSLSRLERYLALALEAAVDPVVVLTKSDLCDDPAHFRQQVERLHSGLIVETLDARDDSASEVLSFWCRPGKTIAMLGSSGVGKSTLAQALGAGDLKTAEIRSDDDKGRHTTTSRSIYQLRAGGLLIDNPGIRELQLPACEEGISDLFADVTQLFSDCRFRDCRHQGDAGCGIPAAIEAGILDARRFASYQKLLAEQDRNSQSLAERRKRERETGRYYKSVQANNRKIKKL